MTITAKKTHDKICIISNYIKKLWWLFDQEFKLFLKIQIELRFLLMVSIISIFTSISNMYINYSQEVWDKAQEIFDTETNLYLEQFHIKVAVKRRECECGYVKLWDGQDECIFRLSHKVSNLLNSFDKGRFSEAIDNLTIFYVL